MSKEEERGARAAHALIAYGSRDDVLRNYGYSCGACDPTDFDRGYQNVIRDWLRADRGASA